MLQWETIAIAKQAERTARLKFDFTAPTKTQKARVVSAMLPDEEYRNATGEHFCALLLHYIDVIVFQQPKSFST